MTRFMLAAAFMLLALPAHAAGTATLTVTVEGVTAKGGMLRVGLYDAASFSVRGVKPTIGKIVAATAGRMTVRLDNIAPGEYAIKSFQDEDGDGKMNTNMIGMPAEPYGFSRDAKPNMGPPAFDEAKITIKPGANAAAFHLVN